MCFNEIQIVARVKFVESAPINLNRADGPFIKFIHIPYYLGPFSFLYNLFKIIAFLNYYIKCISWPIIFRLPSSGFSNLAYLIAFYYNKNFGCEVVGDPYDTFSKGSYSSPLRLFFKYGFSFLLAWQIKKSLFNSYVTQFALQTRYPSSEKCVFETFYSSVHLPDSFIKKEPLTYTQFNEIPLKLICVGSMGEILYKRQDLLLHAVSLLLLRGFSINLILIGGGKKMENLINLAKKLNILDSVSFTDNISSGEKIINYLDNSHLFVLPSSQEGLPRAMIEAMARALPCIGTDVGGISELLSDDFLFKPNDINSIVNKIQYLYTNRILLSEQSLKNLEISKKYTITTLEKRRYLFFYNLQTLQKH